MLTLGTGAAAPSRGNRGGGFEHKKSGFRFEPKKRRGARLRLTVTSSGLRARKGFLPPALPLPAGGFCTATHSRNLPFGEAGRAVAHGGLPSAAVRQSGGGVVIFR